MSDFFEQDNFEDFFQKNLENYESEPSDSLWGKLQYKIPLKPAIGGSLISSVATVLVTVSIGGLLYFSIQKIQIAENEPLPNTLSPEIEITESQESNSIQGDIYEDDILLQSTSIALNQQPQEALGEFSILESQKAEKTSAYIQLEKTEQQQTFTISQRNISIVPILEESLSYPSKIIQEESTFIMQKTFGHQPSFVTAVRKNKKPVLAKNSKRTEDKNTIIDNAIDIGKAVELESSSATATRKNKKPTLARNSKKKEGKNTIANESVDIDKTFESEAVTATHKDRTSTLAKLFKKKEDKKYTPIAATNINQKGSLLSQLRKASTPIPETSPSDVEYKAKQKGSWLLEFAYSPHIWTLMKAKKENYQTKQLLGNILQTANYSVVFTERRKNGWGFDAGFVYGQYNLNHELDETIVFSYFNNFLDENDILTGIYSLNIESPFWKEDRPVDIKYTNIEEPFLQEGEQIQLSGNYSQQISNFQIPAGANYQRELSPKLNAVLQLGLAWSFMVVSDGSFSEAYFNNESLDIIKRETREKLIFESIDAYIGAGLEYNMTDQIRIKIAPKYVTTFRNRTNHNNKINLRSLQLNLGLNYSLNSN